MSLLVASGSRAVALLATAALVALAGCASKPTSRSGGPGAAGGGSTESPAAQGGGYYLDDGPGGRTQQEIEALAAMPDPMPIVEPLHRWANRPYRVLGNDYQPMTQRVPFVQQGVASWYGRRFHGQPTSTGEPYDMYGMTAAHPTLPLPSYARVTHIGNGRSVVVRINDRGPFLHNRVIDLSYLAAYKLGYVREGSAPVKVELLDPAMSAPAAPTAPPMTAVSPGDSHYLQLGAFGSAANAEAASASLQRRLDWLQVPIAVQAADGLYRVQAGPYPMREQAARAGAEIESRTGMRPMLLPREPGETRE